MTEIVDVRRQKTLIFSVRNPRFPSPSDHGGTYNQVKKHQKDHGIEEGWERLSPFYDSHGDVECSPGRTSAYAGQTTETFGRTHHRLFFHIDKDRAVCTACAAMNALAVVSSYLKRTQEADKAEERAVGTEVSAPEVLVDK